ncbi:ankyrin repeat domain-containing protein [Colletotrichum higginsianum IMI 349063]|uniref:Ankyrin repeat domain-containing protein n=1 Tax=Colletotrichum higginsianum (strain IMI 349063) TaxID=759273 RepID=A0A1B7Y894_COLHI|nr:ankyrin repeat domain-containing protein [Colletotrichum higginsianum IMI 349063]OBR08145.1 ankyrin repeat domain-containing protein [Colletotrichum higginsianum IMI 349063]
MCLLREARRETWYDTGVVRPQKGDQVVVPLEHAPGSPDQRDEEHVDLSAVLGKDEIGAGTSVRFIWIDSTCIIQGWGEIGTPELDWNKQALPMHNLNRNFHCNIAAAELKGYTGVLFCEQTSSVLPIQYAARRPSTTFAVKLLNKAYNEGRAEAMRMTLEEVPADLDEIFSTILSKDISDAAETVCMLQWVLLSLRPLTSQEFFTAVVGTAAPTSNLIIQRRITTSSKGLIEIRKGESDSVQFIHLSVRDFLFRYKRLQILDATLGPEPLATIHGRL